MQLESADCLQGGPTVATKIACDDDTASGGAAPYEPQLSGCLGAGAYVLRVRPFAPVVVFSYRVRFDDGGPCDPDTDPPVAGDEAFTCTDFDNANGCTAP